MTTVDRPRAVPALGRFADIVGEPNVLTGDAVPARHTQDLWGSDRVGCATVVVRPGTPEELARVLAVCHERRLQVAVQGGMTGLVSGGVPSADEIVVSTERLRDPLTVDPHGLTLTAGAGITLGEAQREAARHGLTLPIDIASKDSASLGGCVASNAGGVNVVRHGMTREQVRSLQVALGTGELVDLSTALVKDNAGMDLKQLFIGSEGLLGVVTRVTLGLVPAAPARVGAFCAVAGVNDALTLLRSLQARLGSGLSAFEVVWSDAYDVLRDLDIRLPLPAGHPLYVLVECQVTEPDDGLAGIGRALDDAADGLIDSAVAGTSAELDAFWSARERIPGEILRMQPLFGFDVSIPAHRLQDCLDRIRERLRTSWPDVRLLVFGHLGDDNVHIAVTTGERTRERKPEVEHIVYGCVSEDGGSISAEHGIGFEKRDFLHYTRSRAEIAMMRSLKSLFDPHDVLNPGRMLPDAPTDVGPGPDPARESVFVTIVAAAARHGALNLAQGVFDHGPPRAVLDELARVPDGVVHQYAPSPGLPALREALADDVGARCGFVVSADSEVTVTTGATEGLYCALAALLADGGEVIVVEPAYEAYVPVIRSLGGTVRRIVLDSVDDRLDVPTLRAAVTDRTRALLVNTPWNPWGRMLTDDEWSAIAEVATAHGVVVVSDETYEDLVLDGTRPRGVLEAIADPELRIKVSSASKSFAVTGWRVGWAVSGPRLTARLRAVHQFLTFCPGVPFQAAIAATLRRPDVGAVRDEVRQATATRVDRFVDALRDLGVDAHRPQAGFYVCADVGRDALGWCEDVIRDGGVAALPLQAFYAEPPPTARRSVRFAVCKKPETVDEAVARLTDRWRTP